MLLLEVCEYTKGDVANSRATAYVNNIAGKERTGREKSGRCAESRRIVCLCLLRYTPLYLVLLQIPSNIKYTRPLFNRRYF